ncbi:MAG TPA: Uma2 family endonuclease [Archangium sp.]|jgi:Uma2 family endonuclease|uniref:Uma2 family endonuclease n=1 Tax=Archangium sp. TaxID=1872627 RepID=UPI002EDADF29
MSSTARAPRSPATLADLEALPETVVGEIIDGTLYTHPRPRPRHVHFGGRLSRELQGPFELGSGGPGGWWILIEPGIQVEGSAEFVPDLAGWRRERLPELPEDRLSVVPDWVCEILSPSTRAYDQRIKRPFYARIGVRHLWFVDLEARTLTVSELLNGRWLELGVYGEEDVIRAAPFEATELKLGEIWPPAPTS